jgi:hypothetical protein
MRIIRILLSNALLKNNPYRLNLIERSLISFQVNSSNSEDSLWRAHLEGGWNVLNLGTKLLPFCRAEFKKRRRLKEALNSPSGLSGNTQVSPAWPHSDGELSASLRRRRFLNSALQNGRSFVPRFKTFQPPSKWALQRLSSEFDEFTWKEIRDLSIKFKR